MDNSSQAVRCINHKYIVVEWSQQDMSGTLKKISRKSNSETNSCGYDNRIITKKAIEYYEKMLIMAEKETQTIKRCKKTYDICQWQKHKQGAAIKIQRIP